MITAKQICWQIENALDAVIFDCDATLAGIEGIDELARVNGVEQQVMELTAAAMETGSLNVALYEQRLDFVRPTRQQLNQLADHYYQQRATNIEQIIKTLQTLGKTVYVISAGILSSVADFATRLGVARECVFAVDVKHDTEGNYQTFDKHSPLVNNHGKIAAIEQIKQQHPCLAHIGDGMNDFSAKSHVQRFIGFGGFVRREYLAQNSDLYLLAKDMSAVLPLLLTREETAGLDKSAQALFLQGKKLLSQNNLLIKGDLYAGDF